MKYCICHFLFCCLHVEPVQTGYPWQPFYNAWRNTLEEVPFYLGWRAGMEAAEKSNERAKVTADRIFFHLISVWVARLKWSDLQKKKKKEKRSKLQTGWIMKRAHPGTAEETRWHNILSVPGLNTQENLFFFLVTELKILLCKCFVTFVPSTQEDGSAACDSQRHSGAGIRSTGARCPGPGGRVQSCGIQQAWAWWEWVCVCVCVVVMVMVMVRWGWGGGAQPAGSSAGVSQSPCQELTGPIREELGPHPCMQISAEVEGVCRGSCHGRRSAHALITWAGKTGGRITNDLAPAEGEDMIFGYVTAAQKWLQCEKADIMTFLVNLI